MIVKKLLMLGVGLLVLSLTNTNAEEKQKTIEGTWIPVSAEVGGQKLPDDALKGTRLILKAGQYSYQNDRGVDQGNYKLLTVDDSRAMDINGTEGPNKGRTFLAIYELSGDSLKICYDLEGKVRPKSFKTEKGTKQFLAEYKRVP
jgi:uncharacterized protein (TIGR03067 family)